MLAGMPPISQAPPSSIAARLDDCVFAIRKRVAIAPRVGVVLGSGLGAFADTLARPREDPLPRPAAHAGVGRRRSRRQPVLRPRRGSPGRLHAGARAPLRGPPGRQGRARRAHDGAHGRALRAADERRGRPRAVVVGRRPDGRRRPPQPDRDLAAPRPERRRPRPALPRHDGGLRSGAPRSAARGSRATQSIAAARGGLRRRCSGPRTRRPPRCAWSGRSARTPSG